jgi:hypothetical protein
MRPEKWAKKRKNDFPQRGGVLVIGDVTKKPEYNTAESDKAKKLEVAFEKDSGGKIVVSSRLFELNYRARNICKLPKMRKQTSRSRDHLTR